MAFGGLVFSLLKRLPQGPQQRHSARQTENVAGKQGIGGDDGHMKLVAHSYLLITCSVKLSSIVSPKKTWPMHHFGATRATNTFHLFQGIH